MTQYYRYKFEDNLPDFGGSYLNFNDEQFT